VKIAVFRKGLAKLTLIRAAAHAHVSSGMMRFQTMTLRNCIYQFKISLKEITPIVWRRIQVPTNYNFWDLHVAIQDSMGWLDYHLHQFSIKRPHAHKTTEIGIPDEEGFFDDIVILPGWKVDVPSYFTDLGVLANAVRGRATATN
jgi:hypothetical protein